MRQTMIRMGMAAVVVMGMAQVGTAADVALLAASVVRKSGVTEGFSQLPEYVSRVLTSYGSRMSAGRREKVQVAANKAFDGRLLQKEMIAKYREGFDGNVLQVANDWFDSELGRKIADQMRQSGQPGTAEEQKLYQNSLTLSPPSAERLELMDRIDEAVGASDQLADMVTMTSMGVALAINATAGSEKQIDLDAVERHYGAQRASLAMKYREPVTSGFLFKFRDLSDDEIKKFLEFAEGSEGRVYYEKSGQMMREVLQAAALDAARGAGGLPAKRVAVAPDDENAPSSVTANAGRSPRLPKIPAEEESSDTEGPQGVGEPGEPEVGEETEEPGGKGTKQ